jgi:hypothetical protein
MSSTIVSGRILSCRPQPTILLIAHALCALTMLLLAASAFTAYANAQTLPLPYGNVENQGVPTPCPSTGGWVPGTTCRSALMICDQSLNVAPMGFTYGYALPAGANNGTVVAFSGR